MQSSGRREPVKVASKICWSGVVLVACLLCSAALVAGDVADGVQAPDTLAQRMAACTSCHGKHGQGGDNGFNPRLAGKPTLYLYHQLLNFREGRRSYPMMQHMVTGLSDAYLHEMAEYFSGLDTAYPKPPASELPAALLALGRNLVEHGDTGNRIPACTACHGQRLTGVEPGIPGLIGLPSDYISNQLGAWRNGTRKAAAPDCMAKVAKRLDGRQIVAVAAWLSSHPIPDDVQPEPASSLQRLPLQCGSQQP